MVAVTAVLSVPAFAETFLFEPYVDAHYSCNYLEGANSLIQVDAESAEHAVKLVSSMIGQELQITCNQDIYQCVHKHGDVEPRVVERSSVEKNLVVIGGRMLNAETHVELLPVGSEYYHRNLRPPLKCKY